MPAFILKAGIRWICVISTDHPHHLPLILCTFLCRQKFLRSKVNLPKGSLQKKNVTNVTWASAPTPLLKNFTIKGIGIKFCIHKTSPTMRSWELLSLHSNAPRLLKKRKASVSPSFKFSLTKTKWE